MTAPHRGRFRAPWLALPLAMLTVLGTAAPAFADDEPSAAPAAAAMPAEPIAQDASAEPAPASRAPHASVAAASQSAAPSITVAPSTFDPGAAQSLTVAGTGFVGDGAVNGAYVVIGETADWSPGTSPLGASFPIQVWVRPAQISDGAFSTVLTVPAGTLGLGSSYSVGTFAAHALAYTDRSLDTWTELTLRSTPVANPVLTVTPTTIDPAVQNTLTVTGTGYVGDGAVNGAYIVVGETGGWTAGSSPQGVTFAVSAWVRATAIVDGTFTTTITIPAATLDDGGAYSIGSFAAQALAFSDRSLDTWQPLTVRTPETAAPRIVLGSSSIDASTDTTLSVTGTGFVGAGAASGAYVVLGETSVWTAGTTPLGVVFPVQAWVRPTDISAGAFTATLTVPAGTLTAGTSYSVGTFAAHALAYTDRSLDTWTRVAVTDGSTGNPGGQPTTPPVTPPGSPSPRLSVSPGAVDPSVATTLTITGTGYRGAGAANGVYVSVGETGDWRPGQAPAQGGWIVSGWVAASKLTAAGTFTTTLRIPAGALENGSSYGVASFAAHELALTNRSLDAWTPLTLTGSASRAGSVVQAKPAPTPPSDEGIRLEESELTEGDVVSASATGFEPNEEGILVVIYSDPVVLDNDARADAEGTVHWTGRLPGDLTGRHTLTFQGSAEAGVPVEIAPRERRECTIDGARMEWGFKESFRAYLSSSIANGEWTTTGDADYTSPAFTFRGGSGDRDADTGAAVVQFHGEVRFTGHEGALDTRIANPRLEIGAESAMLLLDVSGTTQEGLERIRVGVPFAELDLSGVQPVSADGFVQLSQIPARLTAEGAELFGTYEAGEALDPVTVTVPEAGCTGIDATPVDATGSPEPARGVAWPIWVGGVALLAAVILVAVVVMRRRAT